MALVGYYVESNLGSDSSANPTLSSFAIGILVRSGKDNILTCRFARNHISQYRPNAHLKCII